MVGAPRNVPTDPPVAERVRAQAAAIWRGEAVGNSGFSGLNSERAVRERLQGLVIELLRVLAPSDPLRDALSIDWMTKSPLSLLEHCESLLDHDEQRVKVKEGLERLLMVQAIAGRLGRWAVRVGEISDARVARSLYRDAALKDPAELQSLIDRATAALAHGAHREAVVRFLEADRLQRSAPGLLRVGVSLCRLGDHVGALWAIRASLLEPRSSFESAEAHDAAMTLEERLHSAIQARHNVPLDPEEARLLRGQSIRERPPALVRSRIVDRRPAPPSALELPPLPVSIKVTTRQIPIFGSEPPKELLAVQELITTEIIPPLMRGSFDPSIFDEPLNLVSTSYEIDAPFEERSPFAWLDAPTEPIRAQVRPLSPEEAPAPEHAEIQPLLGRFTLEELSQPGSAPVVHKKTYDKTQRVRIRAFEAVLLDLAD